MFIYLFVYMYGRMYVILYFDPRVFVLVMWSAPSQIALTESSGLSISTRITLEIELFTVLNSFAGGCSSSLKTYRTSISIRVSGGGKSMRSLSWL